MTLLSPPVSRGGQPPEDLDWKLRALFRAQMPHPWPPAPATTAGRTAPPPAARPRTRWPLLRSRVALAASVALLATGLLFLTGAFKVGPAAPGQAIPVVGPTAGSDNNPLNHPAPPKVNFPSDTPKGMLPSDPVSPSDVKVHEIFIQESGGTSYRVIVSPK